MMESIREDWMAMGALEHDSLISSSSSNTDASATYSVEVVWTNWGKIQRKVQCDSRLSYLVRKERCTIPSWKETSFRKEKSKPKQRAIRSNFSSLYSRFTNFHHFPRPKHSNVNFTCKCTFEFYWISPLTNKNSQDKRDIILFPSIPCCRIHRQYSKRNWVENILMFPSPISPTLYSQLKLLRR